MTALAWPASLTDPFGGGFAWPAALEVVVVGATCGAFGTWAMTLGRVYEAESLSHALLPGLALAALAGVALPLGAVAGVAVAAAAIAVARRVPRVDGPAATAAAVTTLFGIGGLAAPAGGRTLEALAFGDPLAATAGEAVAGAALAAAAAIGLWLLHRRLVALAFDPGAAASLGASPHATSAGLLAALAIVVAVAAHLLGSLLALALLAGPATGAVVVRRGFARRLLTSAGLGAGAGLTGLYLSYAADVPSGAAVALCCVAAASPALVTQRAR